MVVCSSVTHIQNKIFKKALKQLYLYQWDKNIPERCGKTHSSCCWSHPVDCERNQQRLQPTKGWGDTHSDKGEGSCHWWKQIEPNRIWMKHLGLKTTVWCGSCLPITLRAWVAQRLISIPDGDSTTPCYDDSHDTVGQGVDKLTGMEQLTQ